MCRWGWWTHGEDGLSDAATSGLHGCVGGKDEPIKRMDYLMQQHQACIDVWVGTMNPWRGWTIWYSNIRLAWMCGWGGWTHGEDGLSDAATSGLHRCVGGEDEPMERMDYLMQQHQACMDVWVGTMNPWRGWTIWCSNIRLAWMCGWGRWTHGEGGLSFPAMYMRCECVGVENEPTKRMEHNTTTTSGSCGCGGWSHGDDGLTLPATWGLNVWVWRMNPRRRRIIGYCNNIRLRRLCGWGGLMDPQREWRSNIRLGWVGAWYRIKCHKLSDTSDFYLQVDYLTDRMNEDKERQQRLLKEKIEKQKMKREK